MHNIAILMTTFMRNDLAFENIQHIQPYLSMNIGLLIGDQNKFDNKLNENTNWHFTVRYDLPYDCGLSFSRNYLMEKAKTLGYDYCLIMSDSMQLNKEFFNKLPDIIEFLQSNQSYGLVGFDLLYRQKWEGDLSLVPKRHFEIKQLHKEKTTPITFNKINLYPVTVCRNFFLAKTQCLLDNKWDNEFGLGEHEDFFYRLSLTDWKCFYTDDLNCDYISYKSIEYSKMRQRLYTEFVPKLRKKYKLTHWVRYIK